MTAPNKVRALIGSFALNNPVQFNRPDGAGYEFVAETVLALDKFNPQIAARILGSFPQLAGLGNGPPQPRQTHLAARCKGRRACRATSLKL